MNQTTNKPFFSLINVTIIALVIYNILFWASMRKLFLPEFYASVAGRWKLMMFLEFLAVASILVDIIVRFDSFSIKNRKSRLFISAFIGILFMAKFILGIIELYMRGEVRP